MVIEVINNTVSKNRQSCASHKQTTFADWHDIFILLQSYYTIKKHSLRKYSQYWNWPTELPFSLS